MRSFLLVLAFALVVFAGCVSSGYFHSEWDTNIERSEK